MMTTGMMESQATEAGRWQLTLLRNMDWMKPLRASLAMLVLLFAVAAAHSTWAADGPVNINTAAPEELSAVLSGVGLAKARRIVEYREMHGPFEHIDELAEVRGIGTATVEKNRERITLE